MPLKPVTLPASMKTGTREKVALYVWAYLRLGGKPIECDDVRRRLTYWLRDEGHNHTNGAMATAWAALRDAEWCDSLASDTGARTVGLSLRDGYNYNEFLSTYLPRMEPAPDDAVASNDGELPLLEPEPVDVYRLPELIDLLTKYSQTEPEKYTAWADSIIPMLQRKVN